MATKTKSDTITKTRATERIREPSRYNVIFINDDITPMDFVIQLLVEIFNKSLEDAQNITLQIHYENKAIVGTYSYEIAEQKTNESNMLSHHHGYPLTVLLEEI